MSTMLHVITLHSISYLFTAAIINSLIIVFTGFRSLSVSSSGIQSPVTNGFPPKTCGNNSHKNIQTIMKPLKRAEIPPLKVTPFPPVSPLKMRGGKGSYDFREARWGYEEG
jgi:hypothetical protein